MGDCVRADVSDIGIGAFAERDFNAGERVLTFRGALVTTYVAGGPDEANLLQVDLDRFLQPEPVGLYVNHSCRPNTCLRDGPSLYALRRIRRGEEIRFDYSTSIFHDQWTMVCNCGEPCCRGVVADFATLPYRIREGYMALDAVPEFIARHYRINGDRAAHGWSSSAAPPRMAH